MKKISFLLIGVCLLLLTGCQVGKDKNIVDKLSQQMNQSKGYVMNAKLSIVNNDDIYYYDVEAAYQKEDYYKVRLVNTTNGHEQIILKNNDGVYLLTPSLNKSFKFQSQWPYNNSQIYLLQSIVNDIKTDKDVSIKQKNKKYIVQSKVNYPNNRKLVKQEVRFSDKLALEKVIVSTDADVPKMTLTVKSIDYSPKFKKDYFKLDAIMQSSDDNSDTKQEEKTTETTSIQDIIYPLVLPAGTKLKSEEKVNKNDGERVILTFDGDKPFLLVEETVKAEDEFTIIPTMGEPYMFMDTIGALSTNSLTFTSGNMEYYLVSDVMNQDELIEVASSINVLPTMK